MFVKNTKKNISDIVHVKIIFVNNVLKMDATKKKI